MLERRSSASHLVPEKGRDEGIKKMTQIKKDKYYVRNIE